MVPRRADGGEGGGAGERAVGGVQRRVDGPPGRVPRRGDERVVGRVEETVAALDSGTEARRVGGAVDRIDEGGRGGMGTRLGDGAARAAQAGEDRGEAGGLFWMSREAERDVVEEAAGVGEDVHSWSPRYVEIASSLRSSR